MHGASGYLHEDFRLFHLKDSLSPKVNSHYHAFDKIVLFLSGGVSYTVEGRTYPLSPWDILFIGQGDIHSLIIDPSRPYERIILWMNPDFLRAHSDPGSELSTCFRLAREQGRFFYRPSSPEIRRMETLAAALEAALASEAFGSRLLSRLLFLNLMVELNRMALSGGGVGDAADGDPKIAEIMAYINGHLCEPLGIDALAGRFYISRYYLMHRFKAVTGCTAHNYVNKKRLARAAGLIAAGSRPTEAAAASGFEDYSVFLRSFKKHFGVTPRQYAASGTWDRDGTLY